MRFGTARAFLVYAGVDGLLLLAFFLFWGLHPNGHQRDRGAAKGIGADRSSGEAKGSASIPPPPPPKAPQSLLENQTFSPPAEQSPPR